MARDSATAFQQLVTGRERVVTNTFPLRELELPWMRKARTTMNKKLNSLSGRPGVLVHGSRLDNASAKVGQLGSKIVRLPCAEPRIPRLPNYDSRTGRMELGAFCLLGSIAVTLVLLAAGNAARFSENRDEIAAALSSGVTVETANSSAKDTNHVLTNVTAVPALWRGSAASAAPDQS